MNVVMFEELLEFASGESCAAVGKELPRLSSNENTLQAGNVGVAGLISVCKSPHITGGVVNGQVNESFGGPVVGKTSDSVHGQKIKWLLRGW